MVRNGVGITAMVVCTVVLAPKARYENDKKDERVAEKWVHKTDGKAKGPKAPPPTKVNMAILHFVASEREEIDGYYTAPLQKKTRKEELEL